MDFRGKISVFWPGEQNLTEGSKRIMTHGFFQLERCCDNRNIGQSVFQCLNGLRGGEIGNFQADSRILCVKGLQSVKQQQSQSCLACTDRDQTAFQTFVFFQLGFCSRELLVSDSAMLEQFFSLRCQCYSSVGAYKQFTFQFILQNVHAAGDIRLIVI